jgi:uncharacterized membrane protein (DUF4010 family)
VADIPALPGLLVAALGGAALGLERQRSGHATGATARFGGIRTFTLIGGVAGIAGWLAESGLVALATILLAGPVALIVIAYAISSRADIDATTEAAGLVAIAAGLLAGLGHTTLASAIIAITLTLLVEKSRLHRMVARIDDEELRAATRFAVMAVVVLPLLPSGPFGPFGGVRPKELWLLVLFFTGLSFLGYFAQRAVGAAHGYPLAGALAGLVSSTNVTFTFARLSRRHDVSGATLATGAVAACTVLFPRVLVATAVLDYRVALALLPYLAAPFLCGLVIVVIGMRAASQASAGATSPANPLQFWPALQMAVTFQIVLFGVALVRNLFGEGGLLATGAVLGLTDVDALTISMTRSVASGVPAMTAARAIGIGITANCAMKMGIAGVLGTREFGRRTGVALAAMMVLLAVALGAVR